MKKNQEPIRENITTSALEDVMHESFMPYAEHVILERALPRVEDGLKPVQRRILYTMHELNLTPDAKYKKCARIVGDCMGKYHPHGDTSIYDALARMGQDFSLRALLVDGQGNFGSADGDSPAAMRYTEARLAPIAMEMLRDIEKDTVPFSLNFNDEFTEPDMLPARFPNLLVNGATGIAVGLATNIPPHNLSEVIDGAIYRMENPECSLDELIELIKGPDFPTGGTIMGTDELRNAYATGRGRIHLRAKTHFEKGTHGKTLIVVDEMPYEKHESDVLRKIDELTQSKREMFSGIDEVRNETDRQGIRAVISVKKDADPEKILDCLLKYSDLQITYGINMVAIADGQPKQLNLPSILDYYISYQRDVVTRRTRFDLEKAEERQHIVEGLVIAVDNIDEIIKLIRSSKTPKEAKSALMQRFQFTGVQAQAILDMRLARLTALESAALRAELERLNKLIVELKEILGSKVKLDGVIKGELTAIKKSYGDKRRTVISQRAGEIRIDAAQFRQAEKCAVVWDVSGGFKRLSVNALRRGIDAGDCEPKNLPRQIFEADTETRLSVFTNAGSLYTFKAELLKDARYKDAGGALTTFLPTAERGEAPIGVAVLDEGDGGEYVFVTRSGMIKTGAIADLCAKKQRITYCGLKTGDAVIYAAPKAVMEDGSPASMLLITAKGMSILFTLDGISATGRAAKGVGAIKLSPGDDVIFCAQITGDGFVTVITNYGFAKQSRISEYELQGRNGKGLRTINFLKNGENGTELAAAFFESKPCAFTAELASGVTAEAAAADIPVEPRYSKGVRVFPAILGDTVTNVRKQ